MRAEPHVSARRRGQLAALTAWRTPHEISRCSRRPNGLGLTRPGIRGMLVKMSLDRRGMLLGGAASVLASSAPFFVKARAPRLASSRHPSSPWAGCRTSSRPYNPHCEGSRRTWTEYNNFYQTLNGQFPGPLLRFVEGKRVTVDIYNDADTPEQLHWHAQFVPAKVDGTAEEGTPFIPARGRQRVIFEPRPAGFRFYHTHVSAKPDLAAGLYTGQAGLVFIEPQNYQVLGDINA
jgi:FtsP/CotA-like multicopper oxidase with cupredoxin domain